MLEQATTQPNHRRWLLSAVAAVLLLAIPVATVLVLHRHGSANRPASRISTPPGPVTERSLGTTPWSSATLLADGHTVAVTVSTKVPCGQPIPVARAALVPSTPSSITITASFYVRSDASLAQPAPGTSCANSPETTFSDQPTVRVPGQVGQQLVDGATGQQHQLLDTRQVAGPSYLPKGFIDDGYHWDESRFAQQPDVQHSYHNNKGMLTVDRLTFRDPIGDQPVGGSAVGPIHGHTGQWMANIGRLSWISGDYVWTIQEVAYNGTGKLQLDLKTMLRIANSLP
jgi:hypothetical protein